MTQIYITYKEWFELIKQKNLSAQLKAAVAVNTQLFLVCWDLGTEIFAKEVQA